MGTSASKHPNNAVGPLPVPSSRSPWNSPLRRTAATTTKTGLTVRCELDRNSDPKGIKLSDAEMEASEIERNAFHPAWNYTIKPRRREAPS